MKRALISLLLVGSMALVVGCGDDSPGNNDNADGGTDAIVRPDAYIGDCQDDPVPVFGGSHQTVVTTLGIASPSRGFDLDSDGDEDNLLGPLGSIANGYIEDSMALAEIIIPFEFFGLSGADNDDCVNFALYVGVFPPDQDGDGERTSGAVGDDELDCNDWDAAINPSSATDIPGDGVDNDCNGWADDTFDGTDWIPSTDTADYDGDTYTLADGDCDDRVPTDWAAAPAHWDAMLINPGQMEICGDGFDNNCDGRADEGCNPLITDDGVDETIPIDTLSLVEDESEGIIQFRSGRVVDGVLFAGPSRFSVGVDLEGRNLELNLTSAMIRADVTIDQYGLYLSNAMLGGVLSGKSLDLVPNIAQDFLGGDEDSTLLDIIIGSIGAVLSLPTVRVCVPRRDGVELILPLIYCEENADCGDTEQYRCKSDVRAPDIDVDADGVEIFLDLNLDGDSSIEAVDTCIDGDGTMVQDTLDATGDVIEHCTQALDGDGNPRFVDGFSIALELETTPANLLGTFSSQ
jgi:hypothetical protein